MSARSYYIGLLAPIFSLKLQRLHHFAGFSRCYPNGHPHATERASCEDLNVAKRRQARASSARYRAQRKEAAMVDVVCRHNACGLSPSPQTSVPVREFVFVLQLRGLRAIE